MKHFNNAEWEQENQDTLKKYYIEQGGFGLVRRINCYGCGREFYTYIKTKKYCSYSTCGNLGNIKNQRIKRQMRRENHVCPVCGSSFTPTRYDARFCSNACRQKAYRQKLKSESLQLP